MPFRPFVLAISFLTFLATTLVATGGTVTGSATYLQKIALHPGTTLTVSLLDISLADAPAKTLASKEYVVDAVPVAFSLDYDDTEIDARFTYSIDAEMRHDDELIFRSTTIVPVITNGAPNHVDIVLEMIRVSELPLEDTFWEIQSILGKEITTDRKPTIRFAKDSVVAIDTTCNKMSGKIAIESQTVTFAENMMSTLMACPDPYNSLEIEIKSALPSITNYHARSAVMEFLNEANEVVFGLVQITPEKE